MAATKKTAAKPRAAKPRAVSTDSETSTLPDGVESVTEVSAKEILVVLDDDEFNGQTFRCHPDTDLTTVIDQIRNPLPPNK